MVSLKSIARKSHFSIPKDATVEDAIDRMHKNRGGCVVLLDDEDIPVGIITESAVIKLLNSHLPTCTPALDICVTKVITANENRPIDFAFDFLSENKIRRFVLTDNNQHFAGIVMQEDLFDYLEEDVYKIDLKISDIVIPGQKLVTIGGKASIETALTLMQKHGIGSVLVGAAPYAEGIITEKDIIGLAFAHVSLDEKVSAYISSPLATVTRKDTVTSAIERMRRGGFRRIVVVDEKRRCIGMLTDRDILRQIRGNYTRMLQSKIRHSQEIMDMLPEAIIEIFETSDNQIVHWMNRRAMEMFGDRFIDREPKEMFEVKDWDAIHASLSENSVVSGYKVGIDDMVFEISGSVSLAGNNRYIKLIFKDVTIHETAKRDLRARIDEEIDKRMAQEFMLMQQSKLATMGEMIGHIAHQWRQPLAQLGGIFMNIDAAVMFDELSPKEMKERIRQGNMLIKYMSRTIDDFRHFFEPAGKRKPFDLHLYVENAIQIIQASLTFHHIVVDFRRDQSPIHITGYPSEFSQVVLNLLANAKDILVERHISKPRITITTEILEEKDGRKRARLIVEDNGGGIDDAHLEKIFDPYFTTKGNKKGTGLGLYMSRLIIESKMKGTIHAKNGPQGAVFVVEIPKE
ncbi:CBS domain-containing protein [Hydrogenimonas sp.]